MSNPWEEVDLKDYEGHMSLDSVYQLQELSNMMKEQFYLYDIRTIMILGIAGGNGLEHINKGSFEKVYGVDINKKYLDECGKRYKSLEGVFETICVDLLSDNLKLPCSDLLVADLLIEYIGYECFKKVVKIVNPQYVSCIIQVNTDNSFVSDSPYLHAFDGLNEVHHEVIADNLIGSMQEIGYVDRYTVEKVLPNGKKLVRLDFEKNSGGFE